MKLFPQPYLPTGSKGPAVALLQVALLLLGFNPAIIPDGDYGEQTEIGVARFQSTHGIGEDGQFGPETRGTLLKEYGIDVNSLESETFVGETTLPEPGE